MDDIRKECSPQEVDQFLNSMNILFYLIVCTPLFFFVIAYLNIQKTGAINPAFQSGDPLWYYVVASSIVGLWLLGANAYKKILGGVEEKLTLAQKLKVFKHAALIKYAFLGLASFLAVVFLYFTYAQIFLMAFGITLILFSINRPTVYRILKDLSLNASEKKQLREYRKHL